MYNNTRARSQQQHYKSMIPQADDNATCMNVAGSERSISYVGYLSCKKNWLLMLSAFFPKYRRVRKEEQEIEKVTIA